MKTTSLRRYGWFKILALITLFFLGGFHTVFLYRQADGRLRDEYLHQAQRAAQAIDEVQVATLSGSEHDVELPEYRRIKGYLSDIQTSFPQGYFFYLMRHNSEGLPIFLVDSEPAGSEDESLPGEVYLSATHDLEQALTEGTAIVEGPVTDSWGRWISALIPVVDENDGSTVFLFGMDIDASQWNQMVVKEVFLPICLTWVQIVFILAAFLLLKQRANKSRKTQDTFFFRNLEFYITLLIGFSLTGHVTWHVHHDETSARRETFERVSAARSEYFSRYFNDLEKYSLQGVANLFEASQYVERDEFIQFTSHFASDPKTKAWFWIPWIEADELAPFEESLHKQGITDFDIWQWGENEQGAALPEREVIFPVVYVTPVQGNEEFLGFDMASIPEVREAFEKAAAERLTSNSGAVSLPPFQDREEKKGEVLIIYPVFDDDDGTAQSGFVVTVLQVDKLLAGVMGDRFSESPELTMNLYQMGPSGTPVFLAGNSEITEPDFDQLVSSEDESSLLVVQPLYAFGATYYIIVQSNEVFAQLYPQRAGLVSMITGLIITLLMAHALNAITGRNRILEQRVNIRTAELQASEAKYRNLAESTSAVLYEFDLLNDCMVYIAPQVTALTGWQVESWLEQRFWFEHLHPEDRIWLEDPDFIVEHLKNNHDIEYRLSKPDGSYTWLRDVANVERRGDEAVSLHGVLVDVNEHKQREKELQTIATISAALRMASSRAEMLPIIIAQLTELFDTKGVALALLDERSGALHLEAVEGEFTNEYPADDLLGEEIVDTVVAGGKQYLLDDISQHDKHCFPFSSDRKRAAAAIPLMVKEQVFGGLWVARDYDITPAEMGLLASIADFIANALNRESLREEMLQQLERLATLRAIDQVITSNVDLRVMMGFILEQVAVRLRVDAAAFHIFNPITHKLKYYDGYGFRTQEIDSSEVMVGDGSLGQVAFKDQTIAIPALSDVVFTRPRLIEKEGFVSYFATPVVVKGEIKGGLEIFKRSRMDPGVEWINYFETLAGQMAIAVENSRLFEGLQRSNIELSTAYDATIEGWSLALDLRDHETEGHTRRVTEMTVKLAEMAGFSDEEIVHIRRGALLHDIGKLGVPDAILHKEGPLDDQEWEMMRRHPRLAYHMLAPIQYLRPAIDIPYCHHEKWDGTGYPRGLKGEVIPFAARIFAIIDVYDALTSDRPYREAWPQEKVIAYLESQRGTHFDPQVVDMFNQMQHAEMF